MTTINASCFSCGDVRLMSRDIDLMVCADDDRLSYYSFKCPQCRDLVRKPADDHLISLLMSGGVKPKAWTRPAEFLEPKSGPPIQLDDLIDFGLFLERNAYLAMHVEA